MLHLLVAFLLLSLQIFLPLIYVNDKTISMKCNFNTLYQKMRNFRFCLPSRWFHFQNNSNQKQHQKIHLLMIGVYIRKSKAFIPTYFIISKTKQIEIKTFNLTRKKDTNLAFMIMFFSFLHKKQILQVWVLINTWKNITSLKKCC